MDASRPLLFAATLLLATLAGCTTPTPEIGPGEPAPLAPAAFSFAATGCREFVAGVPVDRERVEAAMPENLTPADPAGPFAPYAQSGKAFVYLSVLDCTDGNVSVNDTAPETVLYHFAELYTGIVPPEGSDASGAIYEFALYGGDSRAATLFTGAGWPMEEINSATVRTRGPAGPSVYHAVWQSEDFLYELEATHDANAPAALSPATAIAYREVDGTLRAFNWEFGAGNMTLLGTGVLRASDGSPLASLMGATESPALVLIATFDTWRGTLAS